MCDIDKTKLKKYGQKYHVKKLYRNSLEMFQKEKLECVSICTLTDSHLEFVSQAAKMKVKAIFLEKPIADNLANARKIIEICRKNNIKLLIDHQRRFHPIYHHIKNFIKQSKIGNIQLFNQYYGGGITNTGTHIFDLLLYFFGDVKSIKESLSKNKSQNPLDPNLDIDLFFRNGIKGKIQALDTMNYGNLELDIFGTKGRIRINLANNKIEYFQISKKEVSVYKNLEKSKFKAIKTKKSEIYLGIENLINSITGSEKLLSSGEDGYKALELTIASMLSSKLNKKIELPIKNMRFKIHSR